MNLSVFKNLTVGKMFTSLLFPRIEKKLERKIIEINFLYERETGKQILQFIGEDKNPVQAKNKISFEELTSGSIGSMLLTKANNKFPEWAKIGGQINNNGEIFLVFYNSKNNKIGDLKV